MQETVSSLLGEDSVASVLDAPAEIAPKEASWAPLYAGLDQPPANPMQAQALDSMGKKLGETKETRAQAINLSYVGSKMDGFTPEMLQRNWPNVRTAYAKQAGFTQGEEITDSALYGHIANRIEESEAVSKIAAEMAQAGGEDEKRAALMHFAEHMFTEQAAQWWRDVNRPFFKIPDAPQMPNISSAGFQNPALGAALFNSLKPLLEGTESALGVVTLGLGSRLNAAAKVGNVAATRTMGAISGLFSGLMGYAAVNATPATLKVLKDPNATMQQKLEAAGRPIVDAGLAILSGLHAITELSPEGPAIVKSLEGKTPEEAATILHEEANKLPEGPAVEAIRDTAGKLLELPKVKVEKPPAPMVEENQSSARNTDTAQGQAENKPVTPAEVQRQFSIKQEGLNKELKAAGEEPVTKGEVISDKMAQEVAMKALREDPEAGAKLVDELSGPDPRAVNHNDMMLLQMEWTRLNLERDRARTQFEEAVKGGDELAIAQARDKVDGVREDLANTAAVIREHTGEAGRTLRTVGLSIKEDYSLGAVEQRLQEANPEKPVAPEESKAVQDLTDKLKAAEEKLVEYQKRQREPGKPKPPSALMAKLSEQADAARARLREKAGRASAGIDPTDLADMAIIGADHIAKGVTKFADWSKKMIEEFGTQIMPHLKDIFDKASEHKALAGKLEAKKKRIATSIEEQKRMLAENDLGPKAKPEPIKLDEEGVKLEAERNQLKEAIQTRIIQRRQEAMTFPEKAASKLVKWRRGFLLSSPTTLIKLTSAALQRMAFTPIEEMMGSVFSKIPGVSEVAKRAPREGGLSFKAEAESITAAFTKGMSDAAAMLKTGKGVLEGAYGKKAGQVHASDVMPQSAIEFFGHLHGALKAPVKRAEFTRSFTKRMEFAIEHGADGTDPLVQSKIAVEAYKDANRAIFMQDNMVTDAYKRALSRFEQVDKETGKMTPGGLAISTISRTLLPIVKVPTNIVAETATYATGLGTGGVRLVHALIKGVDQLKPDQADLIMRNLKKGSIGGAALLFGYFNPDVFGGYYQPGEKRKATDAKAMSVKVAGVNIPSFLLHSPLLEVFQIGATVRRVADSKLHKHDQGPQGIGSGAWAAALGLLEEVPFAREATEVAKMFDPHERDYATGELLKSMLVPAFVQWIATQTDRDSHGDKITRKPTTVMQHVETGIPGLRQNVPAKRH